VVVALVKGTKKKAGRRNEGNSSRSRRKRALENENDSTTHYQTLAT